MPIIASLLENFPPQNSQSRAALLDFARNTSLHYGDWKFFKKLFKLAEESALSGGEVDVELLGILLGRIDAAPFPELAPQLKLLSDTPAIQDAISITGAGAEFSVGARKSWDYSGFRLQVRVLKEDKPGLLRRALEMVHATPSETTATRVYDFDSRRWLGSERKISLKEKILNVEIKNYHRSDTFSFDISDPNFPFLVGGAPQAATWQYMKRRARRLLRKGSTQRADWYLALLHAMLREMKTRAVIPALNWAATDALFSSNKRWRQVAHGRGPYQIAEPRFILKTREENAPGLWDENPDFARALLADTDVPIQANLTALKVLRANQQSLPETSDALLQKFLMHNEPVLQSFAARQIASRLARGGSTLSAQLLGAALIAAGAGARREIQKSVDAILDSGSATPEWRRELAVALCHSLQSQKSLRRRRVAARLLSTSLRDEVGDNTLFQNLELFLQQSVNADWILKRVTLKGKSGDLHFLHDIARLPETLRGQVLAAFSEGAQNRKPTTKEALVLVTKPEEILNRVAWQFLASTAMEEKAARNLWDALTQTYYVDEVYRAAFSDVAVPLWRRANYSVEETRRLLDYYMVWSQVSRFASWGFLQVALEPLAIGEQLAKIFPALSTLPFETGVGAVAFYSSAARDFSPSAAVLRDWMKSPSLAQWDLLAQTAVPPEALRELSPTFFSREWNASAAELFRRADFENAAIADWLQKNPALRADFPPEFFLAVLDALSGEAKIRFILEAGETQWQAAREQFLQLLQNDSAALSAFWDGALAALGRDALLDARILGDAEIANTFLKIAPGAFTPLLQKFGASQETLLLRWLETHSGKLPQGDEVLIAAATNASEAIRLWGLRRVRVLGINVALALRLMESGLPQPFALGREYFESASRGSNEEQNYALALCDSPHRHVQEYGRDFLARRANTLLTGDTLQKLAEHFEPNMQAWVANQLETSAQEVDTRDFDASVLRAKGKARRAKESVKKRLAHGGSTPSTDAKALLDMARGSLARDREWALQQLAQRALAGEEISGIVVSEPRT